MYFQASAHITNAETENICEAKSLPIFTMEN